MEEEVSGVRKIMCRHNWGQTTVSANVKPFRNRDLSPIVLTFVSGGSAQVLKEL